ncbi:hypothetical protein KP509_36G008700 [Ceratopteris richardii]|uniref:Uncharacterized protein n=1 Tax=Ceratopteris richardii TaxID=49495 RepID=A0A8T2QAI6_CERRI|nr:hypothetical protein KP509_36G008700 [Ceratopteris richardii]
MHWHHFLYGNKAESGEEREKESYPYQCTCTIFSMGTRQKAEKRERKRARERERERKKERASVPASAAVGSCRLLKIQAKNPSQRALSVTKIVLRSQAAKNGGRTLFALVTLLDL